MRTTRLSVACYHFGRASICDGLKLQMTSGWPPVMSSILFAPCSLSACWCSRRRAPASTAARQPFSAEPPLAPLIRAVHRRARDMQAPTSAKMQGMFFGPCSAHPRCSGPVHKFVARARHVTSVGLGLTDRVLAYSVLAQRVLRFVGGFVEPGASVVRVEQAAIAAVVGAPMHTMGAGVVEHLFVLGARSELGSIAPATRSSLIKMFISSAESQTCMQKMLQAAESEEAALVPRHSVWRRSTPVAAMREAPTL